MTNEPKIKLFLVDDDAVFLTLLKIKFLNDADFDIETYPTGESCVAHLARNPDVIVLDYQLNGIDKNAMNGMATLDKIKRFNSDIPVVILSSQNQIDVAIDCMQHRAFDYVAKNETTFIRLKTILNFIFSQGKMEKQLSWYV